jgi:hypothetical protein
MVWGFKSPSGQIHSAFLKRIPPRMISAGQALLRLAGRSQPTRYETHAGRDANNACGSICPLGFSGVDLH